MNPLKPIDYFLDRITMYRLTLYYLIGLLVAAMGLTAFGQFNFNSLQLLFTAAFITFIAFATNKVFALIYEAPANVESVYITALILTLIVNPIKNIHDILFLTAISGLAISSKYILAINKKHIFNPVAIAAVLMAFGPQQSASWWVGTKVMLPFVIIGGLLLVRKIEREAMVFSFFVAALISTSLVSIINSHDVLTNIKATVLHSALIFFAFVMLTEPLTSPGTKKHRNIFGIIAGALFPPQISLFGIYSTPELSLIIANAYSFIIGPKFNLTPRLIKRIQISPNAIDFVFDPGKQISYQPGQYMEWTVMHPNSDSRGNRRYLTLASSPTEKELRIGVKFYKDGSSYKNGLASANAETPISAVHLGGNFTMPKDKTKKLAFIAGGIGITPYRSMLKYLVDTNEKRDIALFYSERNSKEFVYSDVINDARQKLGTKVIYTVTDDGVTQNWSGKTGFIDGKMISSELPDYKDRTFYISGSASMVNAMKQNLRELGVPKRQIKTDFFPGYA